ncbi:MAG: PadR family transcriptional regulator [Promethearchaeota archaeon]
MFGMFRFHGEKCFSHPPFMGPARDFKRIQTMMMLWIVGESSPDGITGYQLQNDYNIPQTNVYRVLNKLKEDELVDIEECKVDGRKQKRYSITSKGVDELKELKKEAASKISFLFNVLTPGEKEEEFPFMIFNAKYRMLKHQFEKADSKEKALEILSRLANFMENQLLMVTNIKNIVEMDKKMIEELVKDVKESEDYSKDRILEEITNVASRRMKDYIGREKHGE